MSETIIKRGGDLTPSDLALLAEDAAVIIMWAMRMRIKRPDWKDQIAGAFEVRLGRRQMKDPTP